MRRRNQAQDLARIQRPVGPQTAIALCDPAFPGSPHQAVGNQRVANYEDDERTQRNLRRQRPDFDLAFGRQRWKHAGAAQWEPKDILSIQRFA